MCCQGVFGLQEVPLEEGDGPDNVFASSSDFSRLQGAIPPRDPLLYSIHINIYYYTPLPLNLANKQQASKQASKQQASNKHFSFPFWPLLRLIAPGSTLL